MTWLVEAENLMSARFLTGRVASSTEWTLFVTMGMSLGVPWHRQSERRCVAARVGVDRHAAPGDHQMAW